MALITKIYLEMPELCKQCAWLKKCARLNEYFNAEGLAEKLARKEFTMNVCAAFKWNDELTGYDFEEDA